MTYSYHRDARTIERREERKGREKERERERTKYVYTDNKMVGRRRDRALYGRNARRLLETIYLDVSYLLLSHNIELYLRYQK